MSVTHGISDKDITKFKTHLLILVANCDEPARLLEAAAALDDHAERMIRERIDEADT